MKFCVKPALAMLIITALSACSKQEEKPAGVIPAYQQQALDKAHATEQVLQDAAEQHREEMEKQGG